MEVGGFDWDDLNCTGMVVRMYGGVVADLYERWEGVNVGKWHPVARQLSSNFEEHGREGCLTDRVNELSLRPWQSHVAKPPSFSH